MEKPKPLLGLCGSPTVDYCPGIKEDVEGVDLNELLQLLC